MNYAPKVTIIIPLYNGSNYIRQSIECAIHQTYANTEVIVVNDGSTDDGAGEKISLEYINNIKYLTKANGGVSSALNFAIERMEGEWFSWLSHDDLYTLDKIEKQIAYINQIKSKDLNIDIDNVIIHCNSEIIDVNGKTIYKTTVPYVDKVGNLDVILKNLRRNQLGGCSFLLPRNCINSIGGFNEDIKTISDFDYWYRLFFAGFNFYQMHDMLVMYRAHGAQVTYKMSDVAEREINDFYIWVAKSMLDDDQYMDFKNLFFIACCTIEKRYHRAFKKILYYCKPLTSKTNYMLNFIFRLPVFYFQGVFRIVLRKAFIRLKVK